METAVSILSWIVGIVGGALVLAALAFLIYVLHKKGKLPTITWSWNAIGIIAAVLGGVAVALMLIFTDWLNPDPHVVYVWDDKHILLVIMVPLILIGLGYALKKAKSDLWRYLWAASGILSACTLTVVVIVLARGTGCTVDYPCQPVLGANSSTPVMKVKYGMSQCSDPILNRVYGNIRMGFTTISAGVECSARDAAQGTCSQSYADHFFYHPDPGVPVPRIWFVSAKETDCGQPPPQDGYTGIIPRTSATITEVLRDYGYQTAAIGKWHNTPANQTTSMGPFDRWPTGHGFDYFYGFLAGETSQWEPRLVENTNQIEPPHDEKYHLSEDLAQHGIDWLRHHQAFAPDKPFLLYWAPGAGHGPHQIFKEWADKYKGKFDDGWDAYRERVFARQKQLGWIPADTKLTPRAASMPGWDSIPEAQRPFQRRLMEVFAGFVEHVDVQVGRVVDELDRLGIRDNTIVIYIFGDNGASAEGQNGTISELLAQNGIPNTVEQQLAALDKIGGLDVLGGPKTDSMYHAGWAWAGNTPFQHTKLVASHFGGTRNPMVISWPKGIKPDHTPRPQFTHVNDIAPTLYEIIGIKPPKVVDGFVQDPIDGVSLAYTFDDPKAPSRKQVQYFDNNGSRAIYRDGWIAAAFGPLVPWLPGAPGLAEWDSAKDKWELYHISKDFSEADDLSGKEPERLAELQKVFDEQARANQVYPLGAGIWLRLHPEDRIKSPYTSWRFDATTTRMPEFSAPGIGRENNTVTIDAEIGENTSGVLYALGGAGGGVTLYMDKGTLVYEYNMMIIEHYIARSASKIAPGKRHIEVTTRLASPKPLSPAEVVLKVDGQEVARTTVQRTVPAAFSASETFDVGVDLGSTVSLDYFDRRPFKFDGKIERVDVKLD